MIERMNKGDFDKAPEFKFSFPLFLSSIFTSLSFFIYFEEPSSQKEWEKYVS